MREFRVIIAGSRDFNDYDLLERKMDFFLQNKIKEELKIVIVSGTAKGADKLGETYATNRGFQIAKYPADWTIGKRAGYVRNAKMADNANACVCFWDEKSKGTKHMIDLSIKKDLLLKVVKF